MCTLGVAFGPVPLAATIDLSVPPADLCRPTNFTTCVCCKDTSLNYLIADQPDKWKAEIDWHTLCPHYDYEIYLVHKRVHKHGMTAMHSIRLLAAQGTDLASCCTAAA